jgi:hypothetical protein
MDGFFPPNPHQVEPLPKVEASVNAKEVSPPPAAVRDTNPAPSAPAVPLAGDAAYYRAVRTLSKAVVIGNGLTTLGLIVITIIFTVSHHRLSNTSQNNLLALAEKSMTTNENLRVDLRAGLEQVNTKLDATGEQFTELKQATVATNDSLRKVEERVTEQRIAAALSAPLTPRVISNVAGNLASIYAKAPNRDAKRAVNAVRQRFINKEDPVAIRRDYLRQRPTLDAQTRAAMDDFWRPLTGE